MVSQTDTVKYLELKDIQVFNPFSTEPSAVFLLLETDNLGIIH